MDDSDYEKVLRILGESGQIERYKSPLIPAHIKDTIAVILLSSFVAFISGFYLGVRI